MAGLTLLLFRVSLAAIIHIAIGQSVPLNSATILVTQIDTQIFRLSSPQFPGQSATVDVNTLASTLETKFHCDELTAVQAKYTGSDGSTQEFNAKGVKDLQSQVKQQLDKTYQQAKKDSKTGNVDGTSTTNDQTTKDASPLKFKACFSAESTVTTPEGQMTMAQLAVSPDVSVATVTKAGQVAFEPVQSWFHRDFDTVADFIQLQTAANVSVTLTAEHLIFVAADCSHVGQLPSRTVFAREVAIGDCLFVSVNSEQSLSPVISREIRRQKGIFSPLTSTGNILVDHVMTSCFSEVNSSNLQTLALGYLNLSKSVADYVFPRWLVQLMFGFTDVDGNYSISPGLSAMDDLASWMIN